MYFRGRLMVGQEILDLLILVRIQAPEQINIYTTTYHHYTTPLTSASSFFSKTLAIFSLNFIYFFVFQSFISGLVSDMKR